MYNTIIQVLIIGLMLVGFVCVMSKGKESSYDGHTWTYWPCVDRFVNCEIKYKGKIITPENFNTLDKVHQEVIVNMLTIIQ